MPQPLPLPENYNPQTHLLAKVTENGLFHETRAGASFAHRLVANGAIEDLALAETVLDVVLGCQERRAGDPHHGNFTWMLEDDHVEDLNAVEFNLEHLIPMMLRYADRHFRCRSRRASSTRSAWGWTKSAGWTSRSPTPTSACSTS